MDWLFQSPLGSLVIVFVVIVISILLIRFINRKLNISFTGGMPKSAAWQAYKLLLIVIPILLGIVGLVFLFFAYILHQSPQDSVVFSLGLYYLFGLVSYLIRWRKSRRYLDRLVYEIASEPLNKNAFYFNTFVLPLSLLINAYNVHQNIANLSTFAWFVLIAVCALAAIFNIIYARSKLRIYENGILVYILLVEWNKIESYRWGEGNEKFISLHVKEKGKSPALLRDGALMVPVGKKDEVDKVLRYYLDFLPQLPPEPELAK
jgi:hypothetical protein